MKKNEWKNEECTKTATKSWAVNDFSIFSLHKSLKQFELFQDFNPWNASFGLKWFQVEKSLMHGDLTAVCCVCVFILSTRGFESRVSESKVTGIHKYNKKQEFLLNVIPKWSPHDKKEKCTKMLEEDIRLNSCVANSCKQWVNKEESCTSCGSQQDLRPAGEYLGAGRGLLGVS